MSKINAIRFINLSYNYNAIRVDDETFHLGRENTMLSLRNGGGKSVLVQMIIAPLVHKRYRGSKDRPFASYFTTNKPTFILIEWKLDGDSGYVLTGMMVRKSQEIREDQSQSELDILQFIHEYKEPNDYDIHNIPFIDSLKGTKKLKNYSNCKGLLEDIKLDRNYKFFTYDMSNRNASRNYFDKLEEYKIYSKEWESIVKKVNIKESGLSELFVNAKDEQGLIEDWFLPAIEDKLNKGKNRINEFRDILRRYIKQYKENKSKIDQKDTILLFKEETQEILHIAENLKDTIEEKKHMENGIANLIIVLKELSNQIEAEKIALEENELLICEEIDHIQYEEISFEIYQLQDKKIAVEDELSQVMEMINKCEEAKINVIIRKNIQECSKIYRPYKIASMDVQELENRLELKKEEDKDRLPEREDLGFTLKNYYENEKSTLERSIKALEEEININNKERNDSNLKLKNHENEERKEIGNLAGIKTKITGYSEVERKFNISYREDLTRNILGEYEGGSLELRIKDMDESVEEMGFELIRLRKTVEDNKEKLKKYRRQIEDKGNDYATISQEIRGIEEKISAYNSEIEARKIIIKYIGLFEEKLFNTEEILIQFQRKMDEIQLDIKVNYRKVEKLEKEYNKLKSGRVLELPKDFKDSLDSDGIHYTYGMRWLNKNNKTREENRALVENNPFIPYGLIMTERELENLKSRNLGIYTSFPIPIIKREDLEKNFEIEKSSVHISSKVNFYVLFNKNLLDEEELKRIILLKEDEINSAKASVIVREEEYKLYDEKYNIIKHQTITEKAYGDIKNQLRNKQKLKEECEIQLNDLRNDEISLTNIQEQNNKTMKEREDKIKDLKRKQVDFKNLYEKYQEYMEQRAEKSIIENKLSKFRREINILKDRIEVLIENHEKASDFRGDQNRKLESIVDRLQEYSMYTERELIQRDIEDVEARYKALTNEISGELSSIEEELGKARSRFEDHEKDLIQTSKRLKIEEKYYINEVCDSFILERIEEEILQNEIEQKNWNDKKGNLNPAIAVLESEIRQGYKNLNDSLEKKELIPRGQIVSTEFKKRIVIKKNELRQTKNKLNQVQDRWDIYNVNISSLAEYSELLLVKPFVFEQDITILNREGLDRFRGELLRDYREINENQGKLNLELLKVLDEIKRNKTFEEELFNKPLSTLSSLINNPVEFIEQLATTIKAYDDLMAKLEVDIALIDREKERVIEILLEYIMGIHRNMEKIDKNSTIKVKEKSIKMLRVELPEWDDREYSYRTKLKDMVENLTQSGINRLENNENIEELIGLFITTNNLYNTVVGISNVVIKLYKIEAESQRSISWAEVAKNSGGEGFLSAFVVLSSLLSFMRRDETDIFAESEEGKVLLMDNPFAQTQSSHLLEPLIDIAKKSNTQLICFTGIGGESIYNSFDNIYVLNLISSNLRKGTQYLMSENTRGEEFEAMLSSQVRTEDMKQLGFLF